MLTLGECLIDLVATFAGAPPAERPANVAVGVARQGIGSGFIGAFGRDSFGD